MHRSSPNRPNDAVQINLLLQEAVWTTKCEDAARIEGELLQDKWQVNGLRPRSICGCVIEVLEQGLDQVVDVRLLAGQMIETKSGLH